MAKKIEVSAGPAIGDIVLQKVGTADRPLVVTSVNADGTVNGRLVYEPGDNPKNDGNFQTFFRNVKV